MMFWKRGTYTLCFFLHVLAFLSFFIIGRVYAAHDIAVMQIGFEEQTVVSEDAIFLTAMVEVQNKGNVNGQDVPITVYIGEEMIAQDTIPYLPADTTFNLSYDWAISDEAIPYKSNIRVEIGSIGRDKNTDNDRMSRGFTLTEKDGEIVIKYDISVHMWITRQAVEFLVRKGIGDEAFRSEIVEYVNELVRGSKDEDLPLLEMRWLHHFYRPTDARGFRFLGSWQQSALDWGGVQNTLNSYDYFDAREEYEVKNNKDQAYYILGHVLHLIEDMSLPEHTHLECHTDIIPCGALGYETYVTDNIPNDTSGCQPNKPTSLLCDIRNNLEIGVDLDRIPFSYQGNAASNNGIVRYERVEDYIVNLAKISYYRNRYKADLRKRNRNKQGQSIGPLGEMFLSLSYTNAIVINGKKCWHIPSIGCLKTKRVNGTWWETRKEPKTKKHRKREPRGFYYIEDTINAVPSIYKTYWDPDKRDGSNDIYSVNTEGLPLAHLYARDLIPLAIRYVAGAIDLFWRQTHGSPLGGVPLWDTSGTSPSPPRPGNFSFECKPK